MKIYFVIFILIIPLLSCASTQRQGETKRILSDSLKVIKLSKLNSVYIINATRNDSVFTIVYPFNEKFPLRIKKGIMWKFQLKRIYPEKNFASFLKVREYQIGKSKIKLSKRNHWSIYADTTSVVNMLQL